MEVYIEKEILDKLNQDFLSDNLSEGQKKLKDILIEYSGLILCMDTKFKEEDLENYKFENPLFNKIIVDYKPESYNSLKDFINRSNFQQTIVIDSFENISNRIEIEKKGGLYFTYDNYSDKVEEILENYHKRIDLSYEFIGWDKIFTNNSLKLNEIIINDNYLLHLNNVNEFIIPLIKAVKGINKIRKILFISKKIKSEKIESEKIEYFEAKVINKVIENFNRLVEIELKKFDDENKILSNHDRILYTNFMMIDCPIGFNNVKNISNPDNKFNISTSVIYIYTIFDKFTYDRRRRHLELIRNYIN